MPDRNILPQLQALDTDTWFCGIPLNPHDTIVPLVSSRWWTEPHVPEIALLKRVGINERTHDLLEEFIAPLASFRQEGFRITDAGEGSIYERYDIDDCYMYALISARSFDGDKALSPCP